MELFFLIVLYNHNHIKLSRWTLIYRSDFVGQLKYESNVWPDDELVKMYFIIIYTFIKYAYVNCKKKINKCQKRYILLCISGMI